MVPTKRDSEIKEFQSTLPVGGGTMRVEAVRFSGIISIHPPREGRDRSVPAAPESGSGISIHPPREGRDFDVRPVHCALAISIHPPRVERDPKRRPRKENNPYFNPPSPWGEGLAYRSEIERRNEFQSTLPVRGGTISGRKTGGGAHISIHLPRVGRDPSKKSMSTTMIDFNPPSPWGEGLI